MISHLLLSGGVGHDFATTSDDIVDALGSGGGPDVSTTRVTDPDEWIARLGRDRWDLVTVNALRWRMDVERYAHLRDEFAWSLGESGAAAIENHVRSGGGLLAVHTAVICFDGEPAWRSVLGTSWDWDTSSHSDVGTATVTPTEAGRVHPITSGIGEFTVTDEVYWDLPGLESDEPLLLAGTEGRTAPVLWARTVGRGRVVVDLLGHSGESTAHPAHRDILHRAARWATRTRIVDEETASS